MFRPLAQVVGTMRAQSDAHHRTAVVLVNPYAKKPDGMAARLEVANQRGDRARVTLAELAPRETRRIYLDEVIPDVAALLDGNVGHVRVQVPCPVARVPTIIENTQTGDWIVNHGTIDRTFDQAGGRPADWTDSTPVASCLVLCGDGRDTVLTIPNVLGPVPADYRYRVLLYLPDGTLLIEHDLVVPRGALGEISVRGLLGELGLDVPEVAHAEVTALRASGRASELPAIVDVLVGLVDDGRLVGEVQVGSDFYNADVPPGTGLPDVRRTRVFGRVYLAEGAVPRVYLANPGSSSDYQLTAHATLSLIRSSGTESLQREVALSPHGCFLGSVTDLFPEADSLLADTAFGTVRVRSTDARLYGFYWVERERGVRIPIDHFVGG
jgi:hypothetical protein